MALQARSKSGSQDPVAKGQGGKGLPVPKGTPSKSAKPRPSAQKTQAKACPSKVQGKGKKGKKGKHQTYELVVTIDLVSQYNLVNVSQNLGL